MRQLPVYHQFDTTRKRERDSREAELERQVEALRDELLVQRNHVEAFVTKLIQGHTVKLFLNDIGSTVELFVRKVDEP